MQAAVSISSSLVGWLLSWLTPPQFRLFELHEQTWVPKFIRIAVVRVLLTFWTRFRLVTAIVPVVERVMNETGDSRFVDLCSGGGGPAPALVQEIETRSRRPARVVLTDIHPDLEGWQAIAATSPFVSYEREPVDASSLPKRLQGIRTLFASAHHFPLPLLTSIIKDAVDKGDPIAIFELTHRTYFHIAFYWCLGWFAGLMVLFIRPISFKVLFFTFCIPLIPFIVAFDGAVSCLRSYTQPEYRTMIQSLEGRDKYRWEIGNCYVWWFPISIAYVTGVPLQRSRRRTLWKNE